MTEGHIPTVEPSGNPLDAPVEDTNLQLDPVDAPGHRIMSVRDRKNSDISGGSTTQLKWGARSDVGLVREHNEDSFLIQAPLFCVSDGMGGHAAGEVASRITVETMSEKAPRSADDVLLGAAIEAANHAVIKGSEDGTGKPGMGCTCTSVYIEQNLMAVAHVGDSRCYVLHAGKLVRITHDHSFVEELVDAGEITANEARVHPSRSIITRALGSDPNMYADHFLIEVDSGDRIILCSDGLNCMVPDNVIESIAVSCATPQQAADNLVSEALVEGGHDNVTVLVIDVEDSAKEELYIESRNATIKRFLVSFLIFIAIVVGGMTIFVSNSWYIGTNNDYVAIYQGVNSEFLGIPLSKLVETTKVSIKDQSQSVQKNLHVGIEVGSLNEAEQIIVKYQNQNDLEHEKAEDVSQKASAVDDSDVNIEEGE